MIAISFFVLLLMTGVVSAQELGAADQCQACVNHIANGTIMDWIALALFLIPMIIFSFSKKNLPGIFQTILEKASDLGKALSKKSGQK